jgi:hypothetical protein
MKKHIIVSMVVVLVASSLPALILAQTPTPAPESNSNLQCQNLWWFDNDHQSCSQKQFCGAYMYSGLRTFESQDECGAALAPTPQPIVKGISENELHQSLDIKEIRGLKVCQELERCPFNVGEKPYIETLIKAAKVSEVAADYLKISIFSVAYKIDLKEAKLVRQYWANSEIDEFSVGDLINVFGYLDESDNYLIHAKTVRNLSLQKKHSVFKGVIGTITPPDSFVLQTADAGDYNVLVSSETKIIKSETIACTPTLTVPQSEIKCSSSTSTAATFNDLKTGDTVIVRGVWDSTAKRIQAESIIIGADSRPFFQNADKVKEQVQKRITNTVNQLENKIENRETLKSRIQELQNRINDMFMQLKLRSGGE